jgi:hypothetical protein
MTEVVLNRVNKLYENGFHAVQDLDLDIADGEFLSWWARRDVARAPPCGWWPGWRTSPAAP